MSFSRAKEKNPKSRHIVWIKGAPTLVQMLYESKLCLN